MKEIQKALVDVSEKLISERDDEPFVIVKPLILTEELRHKMYEEIKELVSRYAELSERYFSELPHPAGQLVICDYKLEQQEESVCNIINVVGFD